MYVKPRRYRLMVVKLSGESMKAEADNSWLDPEKMREQVKSLAELQQDGVRLAVIIGGGNILRGNQCEYWGIPSTDADDAGMLATAINAKMLKGQLSHEGVAARIFGRGPVRNIDRPYDHDEVLASLGNKEIVILAGGSGHSGVSTDVAAVQMAVDLHADAIVMSKFGVDGVYTADPKLFPQTARKLDALTASRALADNLAIMDMSALALARDHHCTIHIVPAEQSRSIVLAAEGHNIGSVIHPR